MTSKDVFNIIQVYIILMSYNILLSNIQFIRIEQN